MLGTHSGDRGITHSGGYCYRKIIHIISNSNSYKSVIPYVYLIIDVYQKTYENTNNNCSVYQCKLCLSPFKGLNWVFFMGVVFQYSTHILHTIQRNCCTGQRIVRAWCVCVFLTNSTYKYSRYFTHLLLRKEAKS